MTRQPRRLIIFIISILVIIPLWRFAIAPQLMQLPKDFSYRANLISLDNFFDEANQTYSGEQRSVTKFTYEVTDTKDGIVTVKNTFDVRKVTGEEIFSVERFYGIDPTTGKHVAGRGDRDREGYLFAPRHLKKGQPFTYWHVNYDGPAHMTFAGEEILKGLPVYRYETRYQGVPIDQTTNLGFLPSVGVTRGVRLEPYLEVWIEPVSGRMVKYKDETTAYYYNLKTGERLHPWNKFSNAYTLDSVAEQITLAQAEKMKFIWMYTIIPWFFALVVGAIVLFAYCRKRAAVLALLGTLGFGMLIGIFVWFVPRFTSPPGPAYTGPREKLKIGVELGLLPSPIRIAEHNWYFRDQGLDVEVVDFSSGREALSALLTEGDLDIATVAQTPIVFNSFDRHDYAIIAGMVNSRNDVKILARKDRGIAVAEDLRGKKVGVTNGSTGHYFLSLFLAQHGLGLHDVTTVDIVATALPQAIFEGQVDAVATWEPNMYRAKKLLKDNALILESIDTYREDFYFAAFKEWAKNNTALLERFLVAIDRAETFIEEHPVESQEIIAERLKIDPEFVSSVWNDFSYKLFLDQAILLTFEQQARWLQTNNLVNASTTPNYLDFIYFDALEAVKPEAVTIIR